MNNIPKQYLIVGGILVVFVVIAIGVIATSRNKSEQIEKKETVFEQPSEVIPTVDPSVVVEIEGTKEATISIEGIPEGTEEIEYELSYNTKAGSIEGVFGTIMVDGESTASEEVTFGTCSSGVCRYHEIEGKVKGTFKFSGEYGKRLLEKEFAL